MRCLKAKAQPSLCRASRASACRSATTLPPAEDAPDDDVAYVQPLLHSRRDGWAPTRRLSVLVFAGAPPTATRPPRSAVGPARLRERACTAAPFRREDVCTARGEGGGA